MTPAAGRPASRSSRRSDREHGPHRGVAGDQERRVEGSQAGDAEDVPGPAGHQPEVVGAVRDRLGATHLVPVVDALGVTSHTGRCAWSRTIGARPRRRTAGSAGRSAPSTASGLARVSTRLGPSTGSAQPAVSARQAIGQRRRAPRRRRRRSPMCRRYGRALPRIGIGRFTEALAGAVRHHGDMRVVGRGCASGALARRRRGRARQRRRGLLLRVGGAVPRPLRDAGRCRSRGPRTPPLRRTWPWSRPRPSHLVASARRSVGLGRPRAVARAGPGAPGSGSRSAALADVVVPAVGWVCLVTLRGDELGPRPSGWLLLPLRCRPRWRPSSGWSPSTRPPGAGAVRGATPSRSPGPGVYRAASPGSSPPTWWPWRLVLVAVGTLVLGRPGRRRCRSTCWWSGCDRRPAAWAIADLASLAGEPTADTLAGGRGRAGSPCWPSTSWVWCAVDPSRAHVADLLLAARERSDPARLRELVARAVGDPAARCTGGTATPRRTSTTWATRSTSDADARPAHVLEVESERRPIARVVTERPLVRRPRHPRAGGRGAAALEREPSCSRRSWRRAWCRCASRGRGSCRPPTRRADGSSATCTTAPSSC